MEADANIQLSPEDRARLEGWVAGRNTPQKLVWRARHVLQSEEGAGVNGDRRTARKIQAPALRGGGRLYPARGGGARARPPASEQQAASVGGRDRAGRQHDAARAAG